MQCMLPLASRDSVGEVYISSFFLSFIHFQRLTCNEIYLPPTTHQQHAHPLTHVARHSVHCTLRCISTHSRSHPAKHSRCTFFPHPPLHHAKSPSPSPSRNPSKQIEHFSPCTPLRVTCTSSHPIHSHHAPRQTMHLAGKPRFAGVSRHSVKQDACTVRPQCERHHTSGSEEVKGS